jgi:hypothetical protein
MNTLSGDSKVCHSLVTVGWTGKTIGLFNVTQAYILLSTSIWTTTGLYAPTGMTGHNKQDLAILSI